MELKINLEKFKKSNLTIDCFIVLSVVEYLEKHNIIPYRQVIHNITGFNKRSITRYFKILKERGYIHQKEVFQPVQFNYDKKENVYELFQKVYNEIKKEGNKNEKK